MRVTNNKDSAKYLFYRVDGIVKSIKIGPRETVFVDKLNNENQIIRSALDRKRSSIITRFNRDFVLDFTIEPTLGINACRLMLSNIIDAPIAHVDSVDAWNTFFDLPTNGSPFTSVQVYGNDVYLLGGSNIAVAPNLFYSNTSLVGLDDSIGSIISIEDSAFQLCSNLKHISLISATTLNGNTCFSSINEIDYLNMPAVTTIGTNIFAGSVMNCDVVFSSLTNVTDFSGANFLRTLSLPALQSIPTTCFDGTYAQNLLIPNVTGLSTNSFYNSSFTYLDCPNVISLSSDTFNNCQSLISINIPKITSIPDNCFRFCIVLTGFSSSLITSLQSGAFDNCNSLRYIDLPNITAIGASAFNNCQSLTSVTFNKVTAVASGAFFGCSSLQSATLTACTNVQSSNNFRKCTSLRELNLASCTALGGSVASNTVFLGVTGQTITLTIKASRMTANAGAPDGDIAYLQANNTVTVVQT